MLRWKNSIPSRNKSENRRRRRRRRKKARGQLKCTKDHESVGMHCRVEHVAHIFESEFTTSIGGLARPYVQQQNMSSSFSTTATLSLSPFVSGKKGLDRAQTFLFFGADIHVLNRFSYMLSNCHIYRRKKGETNLDRPHYNRFSAEREIIQIG